MMPPLHPEDRVPILYNKCAPFSGFAKFDVSKVEQGASLLEVHGECSQADHVFCGTQRDPDYPSMALLHGDHFQVYGGSLEIVKELGNLVTLRLAHDGTSPEILIIYGTKTANS